MPLYQKKEPFTDKPPFSSAMQLGNYPFYHIGEISQSYQLLSCVIAFVSRTAPSCHSEEQSDKSLPCSCIHRASIASAPEAC